MNNQVKLIDKDQILKWLEDEFRNYPAEHMGNYGAGQDMLDMVATKIESGAFDYTPPVPTIKPGDKVKHKLNWFGIGEVQKIRGRKAYVTFAGYDADDLYDFCELEVVE
ncbi:hypothetical protein [Paenibacillus lautus]|uniref:hypothetical protein n=1 Tax=Paenibacillus lautus TaxID=1401 RepID=UPI00384FA778